MIDFGFERKHITGDIDHFQDIPFVELGQRIRTPFLDGRYGKFIATMFSAVLCVLVVSTANAQLPKRDTTHFEFVGSGNIQRSLDEGEGLPASTGLGLILDEYHVAPQIFRGWVNRVRFSGQINVANTQDTLTAEIGPTGRISEPSLLGEAIMTPLVGRRAVNLDLMVFFSDTVRRIKKDGTEVKKRRPIGIMSGMQVRYTGSNMTLADTTGAVKSTMNAMRFRLFHDILSKDYNKDFNVLIGAGWGFNSLRGDVAQSSYRDFRTRWLGTTTVKFAGIEAFAAFRIKNIQAEFSYTWLDRTGSVPGISGSRMVTTISFVGGFPVKLN